MFRESEFLPSVFLDESLLLGQAPDCHLVLRIKADRLLSAVIRKDTYAWIGLKETLFPDGENPVSFLQQMDKQADPILSHDYSSVKLMCESEKSTLVPDALYEKQYTKEYLGLVHRMNEDTLVQANFIKGCNAWDIFGLDAALYTAVSNFFGADIRIYHSGTAFLEGLLFQFKHVKEPGLFIQADSGHMEIAVLENGKLLFYNRFACNNPDDFVYYPLFVCEQLNLHPGVVKTFVSGDINRASARYTALYTYFYHLRLIPKNEVFKYSYKLDPVLHRYYSLFQLELCE